ncbi:acyltransferase family protein [Faecalicatena contorta]|uniref:acyltransferase family protein n=1 Tax=Faecalicatena contorta TaxID=39482 RepID=UPI003B50A6B4
MFESKRRINSIDIFRYICAVMIIAIHTAPFSDINEQLGYVFSQIIPRIAVPFFFAVAGYFYMSKLENGNNYFADYLKRLLGTYFIWSLFYYTLNYVNWGGGQKFYKFY